MSNQEKMEKLEEIMDLDEGTLKAEDALADYEEWDSVAVLSFIALMDSEFGKEVKGAEIKTFKTVQDVLDCMEK
jgi:acyl carrier protein